MFRVVRKGCTPIKYRGAEFDLGRWDTQHLTGIDFVRVR